MRYIGWRHLITARRDFIRTCVLAAAMTALAGMGHSNPGLAATATAAGLPALADSAAGSTAAEIGSPSSAAGAGTIVAGRTPVEFAVSQSGAATYRIPLWMPPGAGAVELPLALVYNSRGGNGTLGVGWSLTGLSVITRCNKTWAQDGVAGGVANNIQRSLLPGRPAAETGQRHLWRRGLSLRNRNRGLLANRRERHGRVRPRLVLPDH